MGCSLGAGGGDEFSDIDCSIGYSESLGVDEAQTLAKELVGVVGEVVDALMGWWWLSYDLSTGWETTARDRLAAAAG